jgi:hypothetical protein
MRSRRSRCIFGAVALALALWGLFVTFGDGARADPNNSKGKGDPGGLTYQNLGF